MYLIICTVYDCTEKASTIRGVFGEQIGCMFRLKSAILKCWLDNIEILKKSGRFLYT